MSRLEEGNVRSVAATSATCVFVGVLGYLVLSPLVRTQSLALVDDRAGYRAALDTPGLGRTLWNTVALASGSLLVAMILGITLAWFATRLPRRFGWMSLIPVLPLVAPFVAMVTGWALLLSPRPGYLNTLLRKLPLIGGVEGPMNVYTPFWIVLITAFGMTSFVYLFVRSGLNNIHDELIEAAQISGSRPFVVFMQVTLPLLRPVLVYGSITALLLGLGQVTVPLLLGTAGNYDVLTTELYRYTAEAPINYGAAAAMASPLLIAGATLVVVQRALLKDPNRFVTHGGRGNRSSYRPSKLSVVVIGAFGLITVVLPLAALAVLAVSPFWTGEIAPSNFTLANFRAIFDDRTIVDAILTSAYTVAVSVGISLPLGFTIASIVQGSRGPRVLRAALDFIVAVPLGVPSVVIGAGFLFTYTRSPLVLYGTPWVMILVYVTLMLPFTTRFQLAGLAALGRSYEEAAHASGAGVLRTKAQIMVPLMRPAIASAGAVMVIILSHEFSASLLVRSVDTQVMGTKMYDVWNFGSYSEMAALALVMCVITTVGVGAAIAIAGKDFINRM